MPPVALSCRRAMVANRATATLAAKRRATASLWSTAARHARKPRPSRWRSTCAAAEAARQALLPAVRLCAAHAFRRVRSALATVRWSMRAAVEAARVATLPAVRLCVEHAWQNVRSVDELSMCPLMQQACHQEASMTFNLCKSVQCKQLV